ncbi:DUF2252 domain-containing protein [filamentous cyanobacterium LEGE 11480]|uniref:DUF2252 domain-containing protein n=1 Tax=Romeriopsis navalis LEGE 11480 TaxID=2777977 RepID=A0A928Z6G5_9CYAN|nr:DUF2252 domain-containing protein [Romeriopsis navalis]MBE9032210.1 DUF2252 domain-containing protein [Romeriopsis navalis LEGE 11480]
MVTRDVVDRIVKFNADRQIDGVQRKYAAMANDPFSFFRGTCHLFYQDLATPDAQPIHATPPVWICGDLHLQNFGSFKGDDRLVYFDLNDFDEALLAPCGWELVRLLTSLFVAREVTDLDRDATQTLAQLFLTSYTTELLTGKSRTIHRETATGVVAKLLEDLRKRDRPKFLNKRSVSDGQLRQFKFKSGKTEPISDAIATQIQDCIQQWAATTAKPEFYKILDIAHRIAGNGSLGLERYIILVQGKGSPDQNYCLDLKASRPSSLQPYLSQSCPEIRQPNWSTNADRIVAIQQRFQESPPALLHPLQLRQKSFVLRELQPTADKVDLPKHSGKLKRLGKLVETMAQVTAWGQLRSSGRAGSTIADELIDFAQRARQWHPALLQYAAQYAQQVHADHAQFQQAWQSGVLHPPK